MLSHKYARLIRLEKPAGIWLLMFPCWWGVMAHSTVLPVSTLTLFAIGAFAMRSAGCVLNDMADKELDAHVARTATRPMASGEVSTKEAYICIIILLCIAFIVALTLGWRVAALGMAWLPLVVLYPYMKRITYIPQAFLGITFGAGPLFGAMAMTQSITETSIYLYIASIFWVLGYDTIYACQDIKDDARIGIKSTARLFGKHVGCWIGLFYTMSFVALCTAAHLTDISTSKEVILVCAGMFLAVQLFKFDANDTQKCARLFKLNVWFGALVLLVFL